MKFTFAHAADIHLDSPLRGLRAYSQELADCFHTASRQAFIRFVDEVIDRKVAFVVIAGDIFDGDWRDYSTGLFFVKQMARLGREGTEVYCISGNHDAVSEISKSLPYPPNLHMFDHKKAQTVVDEGTRTALHGRSFAERWAQENIALEYPEPVNGMFNIGVLHTSCEGCAEHANYAPCTVEQLCNKGYDYWALGHVHAHAVLCNAPHVVFPGNLQGRHVRECGPKGFCIVEVEDRQVTSLEHVCCDVAQWCDLELTLGHNCTNESELLELVRERLQQEYKECGGKPMAVRLTLAGTTNLHSSLINQQQHLRAQVEAVAMQVSSDIMLEKLRVNTTPAINHHGQAADGDLVAELLQELNDKEQSLLVEMELSEVFTRLKTQLPADVFPAEAELAEIFHDAKATVAARLTETEKTGHAA